MMESLTDQLATKARQIIDEIEVHIPFCGQP